MADTKPFDVTKRCQNCGGLKKEHGVRKPYKCPTRLTVSYWLPWTVEAYDAAVKAGEAAAAKSRIKVTVRPAEHPHDLGEIAEGLLNILARAEAREAREKLAKDAPPSPKTRRAR